MIKIPNVGYIYKHIWKKFTKFMKNRQKKNQQNKTKRNTTLNFLIYCGYSIMYMFIYKVTHVFQSYLVTFWQLHCHLLFST